ncbi:MAG: winged helix-turn-helix domain-containing protein [Coriobacteriales bacterium]|nr:winged helix-turn-helix domain-containing protein [Coriobacteriales bacterium]
MGYQESLRPISHLAEAAGIKKAIEEYKDHPDLPEYCHYYCVAREKGTGALYACVGGQRCRVHIVAGIDIDDCMPYDKGYSDYYEDVDEALVEEAAKQRPDLVEQAYQAVAASFERAADWERSGRRGVRHRDEATFKERAVEVIPSSKSGEERLVALLDENGEMNSRNLSGELGMSITRVRSELRKLIDMGSVVPIGNGRARKYRLAEERPRSLVQSS